KLEKRPQQQPSSTLRCYSTLFTERKSEGPARFSQQIIPGHSVAGTLTPSAAATLPARTRDRAFSRAEIWPFAAVLATTALVRIVWWMLSLPPFVDPDSVSYFVPGYDLVTSGQLTLGLRRPPGYPLFCAALLAL